MRSTMEAITEPGVYDLPAELYHRDCVAGGSLSSSGAKELLACPAKFHYNLTHPRPPKREFDLGHAAHRFTLGAGEAVRIVEADSWRTKDAQAKKAEAYAEGRVPLLPPEWEQVEAMHDALLAHRFAGQMFEGGVAEQVLVWRDERTGIMCRAMLDYRVGPGIRDFKTAASADPADWPSTVENYGYDIQAAHYRDGVIALGLADPRELTFIHVVQEKTPPFLVTVSYLDDEFLTRGARKIARAREMFRDCTAAGVWPSYPGTDDLVLTSPPRWVRYQSEEY